MTNNEIITICISTAALLVSLATLYFTVFYKKIALIGFLLAWNQQHATTEGEHDPLKADVEFSLSNTGNRELLVRDVEVNWERPPNNDITPILSCKEIPCVIKPSQILLVRFDVPLLFMKRISNLNQKIQIRFQVVSPEGKLYFLDKYLTPCTDDMEYDKDDWRPFHLGKPEN